MKELNLKELMDVELETMKQIHKICIEQGFKYMRKNKDNKNKRKLCLYF